MRRGFTLIEVLIVIAILILLMILVLMNTKSQSAKAWDAKRKADLYTIHTTLEEYMNDHESFPDQSFVADCRTTPCDPETQAPYGYFPSVTGGYRVCTKLSYTQDPVIAASGCDGPEGCGLGGGYNYCLASGTTASAVGTADQ